ncbi:MAG: TraB/GumN family protein, partial [Spirochaetia bacterium]
MENRDTHKDQSEARGQPAEPEAAKKPATPQEAPSESSTDAQAAAEPNPSGQPADPSGQSSPAAGEAPKNPAAPDDSSRPNLLPSDTITRVTLGERIITLLGTAHVSRESTEEVKRVIHEEQPDHVCVEIDAQRYKSLKEGQDWSKMKINEVLRKRQGFMLLANLVLTSFQRKLGKQLGTKPGDEMKAAVAASEEAGIPYTLADREVQTTLRRAWSASSWWNKLKMLSSLLASIFSNEELS